MTHQHTREAIACLQRTVRESRARHFPPAHTLNKSTAEWGWGTAQATATTSLGLPAKGRGKLVPSYTAELGSSKDLHVGAQKHMGPVGQDSPRCLWPFQAMLLHLHMQPDLSYYHIQAKQKLSCVQWGISHMQTSREA